MGLLSISILWRENPFMRWPPLFTSLGQCMRNGLWPGHDSGTRRDRTHEAKVPLPGGRSHDEVLPCTDIRFMQK